MIVRPYRESDAAELATVFRRAVTETAAAFYAPEQIAAWIFDPPEAADIHAKNTDGRMAFVAADNGDFPIGWIDLEQDGHVDMLFVNPDWTGKGAASALHAALLHSAQEQRIHRLFVEASEAAKPVFTHWGYTLLHRRDFTLNGVAVYNYAMERLL